MLPIDPNIDPAVRAQMQDIAKLLDAAFNEDIGHRKWGFALLVFEFGPGGRMNWISNAQRADMLVAMKEYIAVQEGRASMQTGHA